MNPNVKLRNPDDTYGDCRACGAIIVHKNHHICPPSWRVRFADQGADEAREVPARDAEDAAVEFCERFDSDFDYTISQAGTAELIVERNGEETRFEITAEERTHFYAHEVVE